MAEEKVRYGLNRQNNREKHELKIENPILKKSIEELKNKVIQGDCLDVMRSIPDKSIDMILCDLHYGTTQNKWDSVIDLDKLWKQHKQETEKILIEYNEKEDVETAKAISSLGKVAIEGYKVKCQALAILSKADNPNIVKETLSDSGFLNNPKVIECKD